MLVAARNLQLAHTLSWTRKENSSAAVGGLGLLQEYHRVSVPKVSVKHRYVFICQVNDRQILEAGLAREGGPAG